MCMCVCVQMETEVFGGKNESASSVCSCTYEFFM